MHKNKDKDRTYRKLIQREGLIGYKVIHKETDLFVQTDRDFSKEISDFVIEARNQIETYSLRNDRFLFSYAPLKFDPFAPPVVKDMLIASQKAKVGPMAAVAGAISDYIGRKCKSLTTGEIFIENGGDIYASIQRDASFMVYAGDSPLSKRIIIEISKDFKEVGVCTSSGKVGHSKSFGNAHAVTIISHSASLSDAFATAIGNKIKTPDDINNGLEVIKKNPELLGGVIIIGSKLGVWGDIKILPV